MRSSLWRRAALAACLVLAVACAYRASAAPVRCAESRAAAPPRESVVRGTRVLTLAGYELNVGFTPGGRLVYFDISAS